MIPFPGSGSGSQTYPGSGEKKKNLQQQQQQQQQLGADEADAICDVCKDGAWWGDNQILICEGTCLRAVHQTCVGVVSVPEGKWLCSGCERREMFPNAPPLVCSLCNKSNIGIMKPFRPIGAAPSPTDSYCHIVCALGLETVYFESTTRMDGLRVSDQRIIENSRKHKCNVCNEKGGATMRCPVAGCHVYVHPFCAAANGQRLDLRGHYSPLEKISNGNGECHCLAHQDLVEPPPRPDGYSEQDVFGLFDGLGVANREQWAKKTLYFEKKRAKVSESVRGAGMAQRDEKVLLPLSTRGKVPGATNQQQSSERRDRVMESGDDDSNDEEEGSGGGGWSEKNKRNNITTPHAAYGHARFVLHLHEVLMHKLFEVRKLMRTPSAASSSSLSSPSSSSSSSSSSSLSKKPKSGAQTSLDKSITTPCITQIIRNQAEFLKKRDTLLHEVEAAATLAFTSLVPQSISAQIGEFRGSHYQAKKLRTSAAMDDGLGSRFLFGRSAEWWRISHPSHLPHAEAPNLESLIEGAVSASALSAATDSSIMKTAVQRIADARKKGRYTTKRYKNDNNDDDDDDNDDEDDDGNGFSFNIEEATTMELAASLMSEPTAPVLASFSLLIQPEKASNSEAGIVVSTNLSEEPQGSLSISKKRQRTEIEKDEDFVDTLPFGVIRSAASVFRAVSVPLSSSADDDNTSLSPKLAIDLLYVDSDDDEEAIMSRRVKDESARAQAVDGQTYTANIASLTFPKSSTVREDVSFIHEYPHLAKLLANDSGISLTGRKGVKSAAQLAQKELAEKFRTNRLTKELPHIVEAMLLKEGIIGIVDDKDKDEEDEEDDDVEMKSASSSSSSNEFTKVLLKRRRKMDKMLTIEEKEVASQASSLSIEPNQQTAARNQKVEKAEKDSLALDFRSQSDEISAEIWAAETALAANREVMEPIYVRTRVKHLEALSKDALDLRLEYERLIWVKLYSTIFGLCYKCGQVWSFRCSHRAEHYEKLATKHDKPFRQLFSSSSEVNSINHPVDTFPAPSIVSETGSEKTKKTFPQTSSDGLFSTIDGAIETWEAWTARWASHELMLANSFPQHMLPALYELLYAAASRQRVPLVSPSEKVNQESDENVVSSVASFNLSGFVASIDKAKEGAPSSLSALHASFDFLSSTVHSAKVAANDAFDAAYPSLLVTTNSLTVVPTIKLEPKRDRLLLFIDSLRKRCGVSHATTLVLMLDKALLDETSTETAIAGASNSEMNKKKSSENPNTESKGESGGRGGLGNFNAARPYVERRLRWLEAQRASASEDLKRQVNACSNQVLSMLASAQRSLPSEKAALADPAMTAWGMVSSIATKLQVSNPRLEIPHRMLPRCSVSMLGKDGEISSIERSEMQMQLVDGGRKFEIIPPLAHSIDPVTRVESLKNIVVSGSSSPPIAWRPSPSLHGRPITPSISASALQGSSDVLLPIVKKKAVFDYMTLKRRGGGGGGGGRSRGGDAPQLIDAAFNAEQEVASCVEFLVARTEARILEEKEAEMELTRERTRRASTLTKYTALDTSNTEFDVARSQRKFVQTELHDGRSDQGFIPSCPPFGSGTDGASIAVMVRYIQRHFSDVARMPNGRLQKLASSNDPSMDIIDQVLSSLPPCPQSVERRDTVTGELLHCSCSKPQDESTSTYIGCDHCSAWFHINCVDISPFAAEYLILSWACKTCQSPPLSRRTFIRADNDPYLIDAWTSLKLSGASIEQVKFFAFQPLLRSVPDAVLIPYSHVSSSTSTSQQHKQQEDGKKKVKSGSLSKIKIRMRAFPSPLKSSSSAVSSSPPTTTKKSSLSAATTSTSTAIATTKQTKVKGGAASSALINPKYPRRLVILRDIVGLSSVLGISDMFSSGGNTLEDLGMGRGLLEVIVQRKRIERGEPVD
jgi:hypothetical protein